ncbi:MAG: hypothetical protein K0R14_851 [Burkholderiales bacterium]|jgi:hypothetical protein|nr:hypothetical protein [Burkholderiales bacterium]
MKLKLSKTYAYGLFVALLLCMSTAHAVFSSYKYLIVRCAIVLHASDTVTLEWALVHDIEGKSMVVSNTPILLVELDKLTNNMVANTYGVKKITFNIQYQGQPYRMALNGSKYYMAKFPDYSLEEGEIITREENAEAERNKLWSITTPDTVLIQTYSCTTDEFNPKARGDELTISKYLKNHTEELKYSVYPKKL